MTEIILPCVRLKSMTSNGVIWKEVARQKTITTDFKKNSKGKLSWIEFKDGGYKVAVIVEGKSNKTLDDFNYIIEVSGSFSIENEKIDLCDQMWARHPLLHENYLNRHTKKYVHDSWLNSFSFKEERNDQKGLRTPQIGALHALQAHWSISEEIATIVLPTGTGKTETMLSCLVLNSIDCLLVIVPTDALRTQIAFKFLTLGVLPFAGVVSDDCENPIVGIVKHGFKTKQEVDDFFSQINVCVATIHVLSQSSPEILMEIAEHVSHLFIDEAHHSPAKTWTRFRNYFKHKKIVQFTATPFRNDGQRLDGKIVYNYPLSKAQQEGYFRPITFKPINEYNKKFADELIALTAIKQLKEDLTNGFNHMLMVRVNEIERANEIFKYYDSEHELNPVIVHSQIKPAKLLKSILEDIVQKKHRIIICVDMLGEGFDLPELKIAAFHDTKKSLAITLQLAGRFTRVKQNLGPATFVANIADPEVTEDLEDLYYKDSDWNQLLPDLSLKMSLEQENFREFLEGFKGFSNKAFPLQAIKVPLSTIIFQCEENTWKPLKYKEGIKASDTYDFIYSDLNDKQNILVIILGKKMLVKWAKVEEFQSMNWDIILCFYDRKTKLLYVHSSNNNSYYKPLAQAISINPILVNGQNVFRCFSGITRLRLHNVGVREPMGRAMNYIMRVGSDIKTALRQTELHKAIKSNIFGVGYEYGQKSSIGCSHNGRIWSMRANSIPTWMNWCRAVSRKVTDNSIDPDIVLKGTLIPKEISKFPDIIPFAIEWSDIMYREMIGELSIAITDKEEYPIWNCDLSIETVSTNQLTFNLETPANKVKIFLNLYIENNLNQFSFTSEKIILIGEGDGKIDLNEFFNSYPPLIYFVDGSFLEANLYTEVKTIIPNFGKDDLSTYDWDGIDLKKESQTYQKFNDSIQYYMIQKLLAASKYSVLIDDDDKGEIGDVVGFRVNERERTLTIDVYHCKYSIQSTPGARVEDFYKVCGQAQKSIKWMENIDQIFKHLIKRSNERFRRFGVNRFELGSLDDLDILRRKAKKELKVSMQIYIVQPGLAKSQYKEEGDISKLLAVVETYLIETWNSKLHVICSN